MTGKRYAQLRVGLVFCYGAFLRMRIMVIGLIGALVVACSEAPPPQPVAVELSVEILAPEAVAPSAAVFLSVYHAWAGEGDLRYPLEIIESFQTKLGTSTFRFNYPVEGGEGLVVYAWVDTDGDGIHCTPTARLDLTDLAEISQFPAEQVSVSLFLEVPCAGPDWFFPGPEPSPA